MGTGFIYLSYLVHSEVVNVTEFPPPVSTCVRKECGYRKRL